MPAPAVIVLTCNEERNLPACLESVCGWAQEIYVVDSGSTDRTPEIARQYQAHFVHHEFKSHTRQWNWALRSLPLSSDWVLALDADQRLTPELRGEISRQLERAGEGEPSGFFVKRRQIFRGRWIKHGGYYPKYLLKLFRRSRVWMDDGELVDHHFRVRGESAKLTHDLIEDNLNEADISAWVEKHNRYAARQALEEHLRRQAAVAPSRGSWRGSPDDRVLWMKKVWSRLPLYVRPMLYFFYRYLLRLGFLDGKEGFIFHFLQAFWYRLLVDIKLDELGRQSGAPSMLGRPRGGVAHPGLRIG